MKAKSLSERLAQFNTTHNGFYDYSLVSETGLRWDSKITVRCPIHGEFTTVVNNHQRGAGCPSCAGVKPLTREQRIEQAHEVHGEKYDYSMWPNAINGLARVTTICSVHGGWSHSVANHINRGAGCPSCANNLPRTFDTFVKNARTVHGDKYQYVTTEDVRNNTGVQIICNIHGQFVQTVSNHLAGKGCVDCATSGFSPTKPAWVYILQAEGMFKVGITNKLKQRLTQLKQCTPFEFSVIQTLKFEMGSDAQLVEKFYKTFHTSAHRKGFNGCTEWLVGKPLLRLTKGA